MTTGAGAPAVRTSGLARRFGRRWALRGVDIRIERGSVVALLGPNGSGKTTLLKTLATLLRPTRGEASVFGLSVVGDASEVRRRATLMTPAGFLYDDLTGIENLRFASMMSGEPTDPERLRAVAERVGLAEAADVVVRGYSAGMRKRLELARLSLRRAELVLMDEPFVSLDLAGIELVTDTIRTLRREGSTVVFATHQHAEARAIADEALVLRAGRLVDEEG